MRRIVLFAVCLVAVASVHAGAAESIGPSPLVKERNPNFFLKLSDAKFRPVADYLIDQSKMKLNCVTAVFIGMPLKSSDPRIMDGPVDPASARRGEQSNCVDDIERDIFKICLTVGLLKDSPWKEEVKSKATVQQIFDPRVFARVKKMVGGTK